MKQPSIYPRVYQYMYKKLIIVGGGGQAKVILEAVDMKCYDNVIIEDPYTLSSSLHGIEIVRSCDNLVNENTQFVIALGDNFKRQKAVKNLKNRFKKVRFARVIHPSAYVCDSATIGVGTVVCANAFVGIDTSIGDHVILNTHSSVDHDNQISDFASIGPNTATGGNVIIGSRSAVGIGATISNQIEIAKDVVIGAGSTVVRNINSNNVVAFGNPAKIIRTRSENESYL